MTAPFLTGDNSTEAMATFEVGRDQRRVEAHLLIDNHQHFRLDVFTPSPLLESPGYAGWDAWSTDRGCPVVVLGDSQ